MSAAVEKRGRRRVERRLLPPFGDGLKPNQLSNRLDGLLEGCRFCPFSREPTTEPSYYLEPAETERLIKPLFVFTVDSVADKVLPSLELEESQLELAVSARNRRLKRYKCLGRWNLAERPKQWSPGPEALDEMQTGGGMEFILAIRIPAYDRKLAERGLGPGKVLCRREFAVRQRIDAVTFPFSWREFGGDTGYPRELLWAIKWEEGATGDDRYSRPISEALTVYMNKAAEEGLNALNAVPGQRDLVWKMLAAEIFVQIWSEVLRGTLDDPGPADTETLAGQVFDRLARASGRSYGDLRDLVREDGLLELRSHVATVVGVVE